MDRVLQDVHVESAYAPFRSHGDAFIEALGEVLRDG
jgi:hypothetical protein